MRVYTNVALKHLPVSRRLGLLAKETARLGGVGVGRMVTSGGRLQLYLYFTGRKVCISTRSLLVAAEYSLIILSAEERVG